MHQRPREKGKNSPGKDLIDQRAEQIPVETVDPFFQGQSLPVTDGKRSQPERLVEGLLGLGPGHAGGNRGGIKEVQHFPVQGGEGLYRSPALIEDAGWIVPVVVGQAQGADQLFLEQMISFLLVCDVSCDADDGCMDFV